MNRRATMLEKVNGQMPEIEKAVAEHALNDYDKKGAGNWSFRPRPQAFDLTEEKERNPRKIRHAHLRQSLLWPAG